MALFRVRWVFERTAFVKLSLSQGRRGQGCEQQPEAMGQWTIQCMCPHFYLQPQSRLKNAWPMEESKRTSTQRMERDVKSRKHSPGIVRIPLNDQSREEWDQDCSWTRLEKEKRQGCTQLKVLSKLHFLSSCRGRQLLSPFLPPPVLTPASCCCFKERGGESLLPLSSFPHSTGQSEQSMSYFLSCLGNEIQSPVIVKLRIKLRLPWNSLSFRVLNLPNSSYSSRCYQWMTAPLSTGRSLAVLCIGGWGKSHVWCSLAWPCPPVLSSGRVCALCPVNCGERYLLFIVSHRCCWWLFLGHEDSSCGLHNVATAGI